MTSISTQNTRRREQFITTGFRRVLFCPLLGIARQWFREKFGILSLMRGSRVRILTYRTWAIQICIPAFIMSSKYFTITSLYSLD